MAKRGIKGHLCARCNQPRRFRLRSICAQRHHFRQTLPGCRQRRSNCTESQQHALQRQILIDVALSFNTGNRGLSAAMRKGFQVDKRSVAPDVTPDWKHKDLGHSLDCSPCRHVVFRLCVPNIRRVHQVTARLTEWIRSNMRFTSGGLQRGNYEYCVPCVQTRYVTKLGFFIGSKLSSQVPRLRALAS